MLNTAYWNGWKVIDPLTFRNLQVGGRHESIKHQETPRVQKSWTEFPPFHQISQTTENLQERTTIYRPESTSFPKETPALEDIKMLDRAIAFLFLHFVMCSLSYPLYSPLRYNPLSISGKARSFQLQEISPVHSHNLSEEQEENFLSPAEKRLQRHADAIFTNSYRKIRGKASARKLLQSIIGKRFKEESLGDEQHEILTRRQSDSIMMDSHYHQQMVLRNFLGAMLQNQGPQDVDNDNLEDFTKGLIKIMEL